MDENDATMQGAPLEGVGNIGGRVVNPYLVTAGFLDYCQRQGWMVTHGDGLKKRYYITQKGESGLKGLGIKV